jgi:polysaccharide biosynthesis transport protein
MNSLRKDPQQEIAPSNTKHIAMTASSRARMTPREVARILFRHWTAMAAIFCLVVALTLVLIAFFPRSYLSEAKLFIRVGRETVALDPTATTGQTILLQKSQVDEINSALELLGSEGIQRRVVEYVGAERILDDSPAGSPATADLDSAIKPLSDAVARFRDWLKITLRNLRLSDPGSEVDRAVRRLAQGIRVWAPKESTIITIRYTAASPQLARDVVEGMTKVFFEEHLRLNQSEGSMEFFSQQAGKLHADLTAAQEALRDRKNEFQISTMPAKRAIFEAQVMDVQLQLMNVQRELAYSEARVAELTQAIASLDPEIITSRVAGFANEAKDGMREKLYELELQESKLRSSYQDKHPLLTQIRQQREQAEEIVADMPGDRTQTTSGLNPNQRSLELQRMQAEADTKALLARQAIAQSQLSELHQELHALNDRELLIDELDRDVELLEQRYRMHAEKLEQARVNEALGRGRITNVKIAQPATIASKPAAPNKRLLLALGVIIAGGGALGSVFLAEGMDQTLRTTEQVEQKLGLPVLLATPWRKRRRKRRAAPAVGSAETNGHYQPGRHGRGRTLGNYRELLGSLLSPTGIGKKHTKTVGVIGCDTAKLRSRVAAELAGQAATAGVGRVLLIDADGRRRRLAKRFKVDDVPGWREVLSGVSDMESCVHTQTSNLAVIAPGGASGATLTAEPMTSVVGQLEELKSDYGLVVVDLPAGREWDGPPLSAEWLDEVVLVVEAERTRVQTAQHVKETLERAGVHLTGIVLANEREYLPSWLNRRL